MQNKNEQHWLLYADDSVNSRPFLFHKTDKDRASLASEYAPLACTRCRKFDERKALALGIFGDHRVAENVDYFKANEGIAIVSQRMRGTIDGIKDSAVEFLDMPESPTFYVAMPRKVFLPVANDPAFEATNLCPTCGRFRSVVWGSERPKINEPCQIGVFLLENRISVHSVWVVSSSALQQLRSVHPPLKGFRVDEEDTVFSTF